jgi:hypothetical protein
MRERVCEHVGVFVCAESKVHRGHALLKNAYTRTYTHTHTHTYMHTHKFKYTRSGDVLGSSERNTYIRTYIHAYTQI